MCRWARPYHFRSEYLENQTSDSIKNGVNGLDVICLVRIECKNSTLGAEFSTFSGAQKGAGLPSPTTVITNMHTIFLYDSRNTSVPGTKKITDKFLMNFEKIAVRRSLSKFLHGLKADPIIKWINRV